MMSTEQFHSRFQNRCESDVLSALRNSEPQFGNELSTLEIGGKVDRLISSLETQGLSSGSFNCLPNLKDKWEAFVQVESDKHLHSRQDGTINMNFLQLLLSDCCQFMSSNAFAPKLESLQTKLGIYEGGASPNNIPALLMQIPNLNEAFQCLEYYHQNFEWIHRLLHWPSFRLKVSQVLSEKHRITGFSRLDIHWLGLLFAACGLGLWTGGLANGEDRQEADLPLSKQGRQTLALRWLRCSTSALVIGGHDRAPSLDSLRTMSLLLCFPLYLSDKPSMEGAMELTTQTINLARQLNLDTDPDNLPCCNLSTDVSKDERRRFMVAILCQEFQLGGLFCKKGYLEQPSQFSLKMPSKKYDEIYESNSTHPPVTINDEGYSKSQKNRPTDMNGVISRYRVGQIWQLIGINFCKYQGPPGHPIVLELDQRLMSVEHDFPPDLKMSFETEHCSFHPPPKGEAMLDMDRLSTYILLASAHIRLHRPFLIPRDGISRVYHDWHRGRVLYYGRLILTVNENNHLPLLKHVSMNLFVLAASIALAVLLITTTGKEESVTSLRRQIYQVHRNYQETSHNKSSLWNRDYHLLGVLLETDKARLLNPQFQINLVTLEKLLL